MTIARLMFGGGLLIGACGCGLNPCRSQCDVGVDDCEERSLSEFPDFETTLAQWDAEIDELLLADELAGEPHYPALVADQCAGGNDLLVCIVGILNRDTLL